MASKFIPLSDSEHKFADLVERVVKDPEFAKQVESHPQETLKKAGYHVSAGENAKITSIDHAATAAIVRPVVSVITKGTRPVVSVVTKGTRPAVQVVTGTIVAVEESQHTKELSAHEVSTHEKG